MQSPEYEFENCTFFFYTVLINETEPRQKLLTPLNIFTDLEHDLRRKRDPEIFCTHIPGVLASFILNIFSKFAHLAEFSYT